MNVNTELERIAAVLSGNISEEERVRFEKWLDEAPEHKLVFNEARKVWQSSTLKRELNDFSTDHEWISLQDRIANNGKHIRLRTWFQNPWTSIAAGFILLITAYLLLQKPETVHYPIAIAPPRPLVITGGNHVATFYLPDSTKVWLNVNSTLSYAPDTFGKDQRKVTLKGEGYFSVAKDTLHPFLVMSGNAVTRVTGTAFNIRQDSVVVLTVAEGSVLFSPADRADENVMLTAGDKAVITPEKTKPHKRRNDNPYYASWRKRNNPVYTEEAKNATAYIGSRYHWKKNSLNQSVVHGVLINRATLASYRNIHFNITYKKPNNKSASLHVVVPGAVHPGQQIEFHRGLLDFFTNTQSLNIQVESADVITDPM